LKCGRRREPRRLRSCANVVLWSVFGRYADRRLMIAALDTLPVEKHLERATGLKPEPIDGAEWLDFVA
jgi:hypothetical protein